MAAGGAKTKGAPGIGLRNHRSQRQKAAAKRRFLKRRSRHYSHTEPAYLHLYDDRGRPTHRQITGMVDVTGNGQVLEYRPWKLLGELEALR